MSTLTLEPLAPPDAVMPSPSITMASDAKQKTMRILFAGAGGMIGSAVAPYLASRGHEIVRLVRQVPDKGQVRWEPDGGKIDASGVECFDAVVHMASMPQARWTADFVKRWHDNHVGTNRLLAETLAHCQEKPRVLVCASAQGIYAPSDEEILTEDSAEGTDFLANLLRDGEGATAPARDAGIRVVHLRIPTVLGGTSLAAINPRIRSLGNGRQWFSWIARGEMGTLIEHVLGTDVLCGAVNAVSPNPVRDAEFFATLGRVLGHKPWVPMPALLLRLMLGDMADELILASRRIVPRRLLETGYAFRFPDLECALQHEVGAVVSGARNDEHAS